MLSVDFSSTFNTIIPGNLISKQTALQIPTHLLNLPLCYLAQYWLSSGLCAEPPSVPVGLHRVPSTQPTNAIFQFADYTNVFGHVTMGDKRAWISNLSKWCSENKLTQKAQKTKGNCLDFRRHTHAPSHHTWRTWIVSPAPLFLLTFLGLPTSERW